MKVIRVIVILVACLCISFGVSYAHSGKTDSNGGHYCRTNCEQYGLHYGEYHFHNGGNSGWGTSGSGSTPVDPSQLKQEITGPPAPPTNLKVQQIMDGLIISWDKNKESNLKGYYFYLDNILQFKATDNNALVQSNSWIIHSDSNDEHMFSVVAVDTAGNSSNPTSIKSKFEGEVIQSSKATSTPKIATTTVPSVNDIRQFYIIISIVILFFIILGIVIFMEQRRK